MRVFVQKRFSKWAEKEGIDETSLFKAGAEAFAGEVEADLGGYFYKKRLARDGGGKSGGCRTILCFRKADEDRIFLLHGFEKAVKGNVSSGEIKSLKLIAKSLVGLSDAQIEALRDMGSLREVDGEKDGAEE